MVTIRDAEIDDAAEILGIYGWYVENTAISFEYRTPLLAEFRERMRRTMQRYPYLVLLNDEKIIGFTYAGPFIGRESYDWTCEATIYLDRRVRKSGFGKKLYLALEEALRKMGMHNVCACIGYPEAEDEYLTRNSAEFHEHMGYRKAAHFRNVGYKFGRWYDIVWMQKVLRDPKLDEASPSPINPYPEIKG